MRTYFYIVLFILCCSSQAWAKTPLSVYTSIEPEFVVRFEKAFAEAHPDIAIQWTRDSTGIITTRLLAEKDAPKADIVFGVSGISMTLLEMQGLLEPYTPEGKKDLNPDFPGLDSPAWIPINAWTAALCVNEKALQAKGVPVPQTWQDLASPEYKGLIAAPNPVSSGSGLMNIAGWLELFGSEEQGWEYIAALHDNVKMYTHSGTQPCTLAVQGETPIGISSSAFARKFIARKAPISVVVPQEGTPWDVEAAGIVKGSRQPEAARILMEWATSPEVGLICNDFSGLPSRADALEEEYAGILKSLPKQNFKHIAQEREAWLARWRSVTRQ